MTNPKTILRVSLFVLMLLSQTNVKATTLVPAPTPPPDKAGDIRKNADTGPTEILVYCPDKISVVPANLPPEWMSAVPVPRYRQSISIDDAKKVVVCWYGTPGDSNFLLSNLISRRFPQGYECKVGSLTGFYAICTRRTRFPR